MPTWIRARLDALRADPERGSSQSIFMVGIAMSLMLAIGLVADGNGKLNAIEHATATAQQAARIAGQHLAPTSAQAGGGPVTDTSQAIAAAEAALAAQDVEGTVTISGDEVIVTTTATYDTIFLSIIGINQLTGQGQATARIAQGFTSEI